MGSTRLNTENIIVPIEKYTLAVVELDLLGNSPTYKVILDRLGDTNELKTRRRTYIMKVCRNLVVVLTMVLVSS